MRDGERFGNRALEIGKPLGDVWLTSKALIGLAADALHWGRAVCFQDGAQIEPQKKWKEAIA